MGKRGFLKFCGLLFACLLLQGAMGALSSASADGQRPQVVASFTILGDFISRIAGDRVDLHVLVGPDGDSHNFEPGPGDLAATARAALFVANGLGFEPWLDRLLASARFKGRLIIASTGVVPLLMQASMTEVSADHKAPLDPHAFLDLANGLLYVANIRDALAAIDPANAALYRANAEKLLAEITVLDASLRQSFAAIPADRRRVLTAHDAFQYFGRAYGIDFVGIQGVNLEAEPSAADMARLATQARAGAFSVIFVENMSDPRLAQMLERETGLKIGGRLYADALSFPGGEAPDYLSLFRVDAAALLRALRP